MAGNMVEISDFIGSAFIQKGKYTTPRFDDIRDEWTNHQIYQLLGAVLGKLFIANLDANGVPEDARFKSIYNPFVLDENSRVLESRGIKYMIKHTVWFYYARDNNVNVELTGNNADLAENAELSTDGFFLVKNFNKGVRTGRAIQEFIRDNLVTYPEYNGQVLEFAIPT